MSEILGGLRARLIADSVRAVIVDGLTALGWFDSGRNHLPVTFLTEPHPWSEPVAMNTLSMTVESADQVDMELGSLRVRESIGVMIDLYAENGVLGLELINDVRDILRGRHDGIDRTRPVITVTDYSQATPVPVGYAQIADITSSRSAVALEKEWLRNWFTLRFVVLDDRPTG